MKYSNPPYLLSVHKKYLKCDMNANYEDIVGIIKTLQFIREINLVTYTIALKILAKLIKF